MQPLAPLTTLGLGGPARRLVAAGTDEAVATAVGDAVRAGEPLLVLGGGSNLVVADEGFPGTVVHVRTRGVDREGALVHVAAGEPWEPFVARCVAEGLAGIEALSGIPGSVGATPIQNVGAYGQEVGDVLAGVRVLDLGDGTIADLTPKALGLGYRTSAFKRRPGRHVVLRVSFALQERDDSLPIAYAELARRLRVRQGDRAPLADVREAVLALRREKGMVLDPDDPDTRSAGSFFTNPVLTAPAFAALEARAHERLGPADAPPAWPETGGRVKTSAAWLIQRSGFARGHGDPEGIAISSKHVLALTNRGAGTTAQLVALAREIAGGVRRAFGVELLPEPVFAGHAWAP